MAKMVNILLALVFSTLGLLGQPQVAPSASAPVEGVLQTDFGVGVQGAKIFVTDENENLLPVSITTDSKGHFSIVGLGRDQQFVVQPFKAGEPTNGVDVLDLYLLKEALAENNFETPYQKLTSDINNDRVVDQTDVEQLQDFILGKTQQLGNGGSWRFYDALCEPPLAAPFGACNLEKGSWELGGENRGLDFVATKVGDLDNSAVANTQQGTSNYLYGSVILNLKDQLLAKGQVLVLPLKVTGAEMLACQFALSLQDIEVVDVQADSKSVSFYQNSQLLAVSAIELKGNHLLTLKIKSKKDIMLSDALSLVTGSVPAKAYNLDEMNLGFKLNFEGEKVGHLALLLDEKSIFDGDIRYFVPRDGAVVLDVIDVHGQVVESIKQFSRKGANEIALSTNRLNQNGVYFIKLNSGTETTNGKIILLNTGRNKQPQNLCQDLIGYKN